MNNFRSLVNHFKRNLPEYKISVRRVSVPSGYHAFCQRKPDSSFSIHINKHAEEAAQILLLIHEISHVLSWHTDTHLSDHGRHFGLAYAKSWQIYLSWTKL